MNAMPSTLQVFDPAMCCSTGVCGPAVDGHLAQFAADLEWLKAGGVLVRRHNLAHSPGEFATDPRVQAALLERGEAALPLLLVNGRVAVSGRYPDRPELARLLNLPSAAAPPEPSAANEGCGCEGGC